MIIKINVFLCILNSKECHTHLNYFVSVIVTTQFFSAAYFVKTSFDYHNNAAVHYLCVS